MITKRTVTDRIEILEDGQMQIRTATVIEEDGVELSRTFHRDVVSPEDDVSGRDQRIRDVAGVVHTPAVKAAYAAKRAAAAQANL